MHTEPRKEHLKPLEVFILQRDRKDWKGVPDAEIRVACVQTAIGTRWVTCEEAHSHKEGFASPLLWYPDQPAFLTHDSHASAMTYAIGRVRAFAVRNGQQRTVAWLTTLPVGDHDEVDLRDGAALQALVPGVAPISDQDRQLQAYAARRNARRGHAPLPAGGLFDETTTNQLHLF